MILFPDFMLCSTFICDGPCLCLSYPINFNAFNQSHPNEHRSWWCSHSNKFPEIEVREFREWETVTPLLWKCVQTKGIPIPYTFLYHTLGLSMCLGHSKSTSGHDLEYYYILYYSDSLVTLSNVNLGRTALEWLSKAVLLENLKQPDESLDQLLFWRFLWRP